MEELLAGGSTITSSFHFISCLKESELEHPLTVRACTATGQHHGPDIQCNGLQMMVAYPGIFPTTGPPPDLLLVVEGLPGDLEIATTLPVLGRSV